MFAAALTITATMVSNGPQHAVVLLVDDLGYGDTHHMGAEYPTPNIDVRTQPPASSQPFLVSSVPLIKYADLHFPTSFVLSEADSGQEWLCTEYACLLLLHPK